LDSETSEDSEASELPADRDQPGDDVISATIEEVWAAAGVDRSLVYVAAYSFTFAPDNRACSGLERDDRWFGERGSHLPAGHAEPAAVERAIVDFLRAEDFTVETYRSSRPESPLRAYHGLRDDLVVEGLVTGDGAVSVNVRSGPCAPAFSGFDPDLYIRDDA
jgi:hypothetical protein